MTGGGWTTILDNNKYNTLSWLSNFGSTANINSTFISNSTGVRWGTNDRYYKTYTISNIDFNSISLNFNLNTSNSALFSIIIGDRILQGYFWDQSLPGNQYISYADGSSGDSIIRKNGIL